MHKINVYGIPNCDVTKTALDWFKKNNIAVEFHDYKKEGITKTKLQAWSKTVGWETLLNKRGTTWKAIDSSEQEKIITEQAAIQFMMENKSSIKRPVVEAKDEILVGFKEAQYTNYFK